MAIVVGDVGAKGGPAQIAAQILKLHPTEQSRADYIKQNIAAGYFGEPYDIGHLVAFLASPLARYINGAAIPVDGGATRLALQIRRDRSLRRMPRQCCAGPRAA